MGSIPQPFAQVFVFDRKFSPTLEGGRNSGIYPADRLDYFHRTTTKGRRHRVLDGHGSYYSCYYVTNGYQSLETVKKPETPTLLGSASQLDILNSAKDIPVCKYSHFVSSTGKVKKKERICRLCLLKIKK